MFDFQIKIIDNNDFNYKNVIFLNQKEEIVHNICIHNSQHQLFLLFIMDIEETRMMLLKLRELLGLSNLF